jgi:hypothetical protein
VRFFSPPLVVSNRRVTLKKAAGIVLGASQKAISGAQLATGTGTMATTAALVTGAAVSATGIGLAAVAGAGILISSGLAASSAYKTSQHIKGLVDIYNDRENLGGEQNCKEILAGGDSETAYSKASHKIIVNDVLPYVIRQKVKKRRFKIAAAIPVTSPAASIYAVAKKWGKAYRGELGKNRNTAAQWLAAHFLECDCNLSKKIIAELYSDKEVEQFSGSEFKELWPMLARKMKST